MNKAFGAPFGLALWPRRTRYQRRLYYNPRQDHIAGFGGPDVALIPVSVAGDVLVTPKIVPETVSGLLELDIAVSSAGEYLDPALEFTSGDFHDVQHVERGARGRRFFNLSRLLAARKSDARVRLRGHRLRWDPLSARLHLSCERLSLEDRVLVISPHPDDAEIAAYGLYSDTGATIVTLTAGDASDRYRSAGILPALSRAMVAKIRVWDSITIPRLGGVAPDNAVNLCYPDGKLAEMRRNPDQDARDNEDGRLDFERLRLLNSSPLVSEKRNCSWNSLVADLKHILTLREPTVIVTPHPVLDPHEDHFAATAAIVEAISGVGLSKVRLFYTCVHNRGTEVWPFGPAGTGTAHVPISLRDGEQACGFYSHALSPQKLTEKFIAVEAMHDIRNIDWPEKRYWRREVRRLRTELGALYDGLGRWPTSYLRRAIRPDEPFFVSDFNAALALPGLAPLTAA